ncbi:Dip2/Utp12 family domain-containing protein [Trichoderma gracile]
MSTPKRRTPAKLAAPVVKPDARRAVRSTIDESRTTVSSTDALRSSQAETIEISSDPDSDEDMSDAEDQDVNGAAADEAEQNPEQKKKPVANGQQQKQSKGADDDEAESDDAEEETSPSFGELLRGSEAIDVTAMLQQSSTDSTAAAQASRSAIAPPSHQSLTTVLTQALKTDDTDLLESCLHTTDIHTIRNTIERIDSSLAGILLNKVAARLHRRPGRAGTLMTWVQWTLVAHGGALAAQPKLLHDLNSLQKVLAERAKGLNSLLALKGKLDLLEGQMELRRRMQRSAGLLGEGDEDDEDEDVIYVEGEERDAEQKNLANGVRSRRRGEAGADADDDEDDDDRVLNGFIGDSEDEEEGSEQDEEESDAEEDQLDEDEVDFDDVDESMGEDEESDVEVAPPTKMQKVSKTSAKKK